jgi:hypothetical protein
MDIDTGKNQIIRDCMEGSPDRFHVSELEEWGDCFDLAFPGNRPRCLLHRSLKTWSRTCGEKKTFPWINLFYGSQSVSFVTSMLILACRD